MLGSLWAKCKSFRKCKISPYDRLLTNSVLKEDSRTTQRHERVSVAGKVKKNTDHLRLSRPL